MQQEYELSDEGLENAFFAFKMNKSLGSEDVSSNVVKPVFQHIHKSLKHIFNISFKRNFFR